MSVINTNITSMIGQSNLQKSQNALTTSMERLSSGLRINSAKDDAAGQAIANRMTSQITGLSQAQRNANDGISVAQTAEGALNQVNDNLQRIRELSVQAQNDTNSQDDLKSIQAEIDQRLTEIDRISDETNFNGVKVLANDRGLSIQVGANDGEAITVNLQEINKDTLKLSDFTVVGDQQVTQEELVGEFGATLSSAAYSDGTSTYDVDAAGVVTSGGNAVYAAAEGEFTDTQTNTTIGAINFAALSGGADWTAGTVDASGNGDYTLTVEGQTYTATVSGSTDGASGTGSTITVLDGNGDAFNPDNTTSGTIYKDANNNYTLTETYAAATVDDLEAADFEQQSATYTVAQGDFADTYTVAANGDITGTAIGGGETLFKSTDADGNSILIAESTVEAATADPLKKLDDALNMVDTLRSDLGAIQNRFESAITNLQTNETNLSSARSRIEDADYATEVANMTRAQILQQAGTSVLAQANQIPQNVLSLLG